MFVEIRNGAASVHEAADLKSLSVRADGQAHDGEVATGLVGLGLVADGGEHAWLQIAALKAAAAATVPTDEQAAWTTGFDGMIAYATSKGWTSADGHAVRAHIERRT